MKKFIIVFKHQGTTCTRIIEAYSRDDAMASVCGFIYSCEEVKSKERV